MVKIAIPLVFVGVIVAVAAFVPSKIYERIENNKVENGIEEVTFADVEEAGKINEHFDSYVAVQTNFPSNDKLDENGRMPLEIHPKFDSNPSKIEQPQSKKSNRVAEVATRHRPRFGG